MPSNQLPEGLTVSTARDMAKRLRSQMAAQGTSMSHSQALEHLAKLHGFRNWNTLHARLSHRPNRMVLRVGDRVQGRYLGQPFTGRLIGLQQASDERLSRVTIKFDEPVDVVTFDSFSSFRSRVTAEIDPDGRSPRHTSDGQPHMVLSPTV